MPPAQHPAHENQRSVGLLAGLMFLLPALGAPTSLLVQDTLKSALLACGVLAAALLFVARRTPQPRVLQTHVVLLLPLTLCLYALACMCWSHPYMAGVEAARWFILGLLMWLGMNLLCPNNLRWLLLGIHGGAVVAALWAAAQFWGGLSLFPQGPMPASTFYNRNFFAEYAVCALPFSVWWMSTLQQPRWLLANALSIALQITAVLMTGTRSALLALALLLPLLGLTLWRLRGQLPWPGGAQRKRLVLTLLLTLLMSLLVLGNLPTGNAHIAQETPQATPWSRSLTRAQTLTQAQEFRSGTLSIRTDMWLATLRMLQAQPWQGVGAGSWEVEIPRYQRDDTTLEIDYYAHNETLQLLSEYGLVAGGLVLALLCAYWIHAALGTWRLPQDEPGEAAGRAFSLMSLLALAIVSSAGFPLHLAGTSALMALSLACLAGSDLRLRSAQAQDGTFAKPHGGAFPLVLQRRGRMLALGILIAALASTLYICQRAFRAERNILTAVLLTDHLPHHPGPLTPAQQADKATMLAALREGVALHPHYRKLTAQAAEVLVLEEDWNNAAWVLQSVADSHPHVDAIWQGLALARLQLHQQALAEQALAHLMQLRPRARSTVNLEIVVLSTAGQDAKAKALIDDCYAREDINYELTQTGYALGIKLQDQQLAVRALTLRQKYWPQDAADNYFRMGNIYHSLAPRNPARALQSFRQGLQSVPASDQAHFLAQVPQIYRAQLSSR